MTKKEFEDRTGMRFSEKEYAAIEKMYMQAIDIDKNEFCVCWRQTGRNPLTVALAEQAEWLQSRLDEIYEELKDVKEKNMDAARAILKKAAADGDRNLIGVATSLAGERKCIEVALEEGYPLWAEARGWLMEQIGTGNRADDELAVPTEGQKDNG